MGLIYLITTPNSSYVGQTTREFLKRMKEHIRSAYIYQDSCPRLCEAIREFGLDQICMDIIGEFPDDKLNEMEKHYIDLFNTHYPDGLNMTRGGSGWSGMSDDAKERATAKRRKYTDFNLPMYVSEFHCDWRGSSGFIVAKPRCESIFICSKLLTMDQKYELALEVYMMTAEEIQAFHKRRPHGGKNTAGEDYPLPEYMSYHPGKYTGFSVRFKGAPERKFCNSRVSFGELYNLAIEYLDYLKSGGVPIPARRLYDIDGDDIVLDKHIQKTPKPHGLAVIVFRGHTANKYFESKDASRNYTRAKAYLEECKRMQLID